MKREEIIEEIKFKLSGSFIELELEDEQLNKVIDISLREIQRYIDATLVMTIPFEKCIDFSNMVDEQGNKLIINAVTQVFRSQGFNNDLSNNAMSDPVYAQQVQLLSGTGNMHLFQDYMYNYMSYNTLEQIRNSTSTDLAHYFDIASQKLYINLASGFPSEITIEYIPQYNNVEQIKSPYWIDLLIQMAVANTKIILGRIRSRYTQSNALWTQDGETILNEGKQELQEIRQHLVNNECLWYPID